MDDTNKKHLENLLKHVELVRENCEFVGKKLIEQNEEQLGIALIARGRCHDLSKFYGVEFLYLNGESKEKTPDLFKLAAQQHYLTNSHHPEFHPGGIKCMPRIDLAEMTIDWFSRSIEFGDSIHDWVSKKATKKYGYTTNSKVYKNIREILDLLLQPKFK